MIGRASDPSAGEFYAAFRKVIDEQQNALNEHWSHSPKYTTLIERMLPKVACELNMRYAKECHRLDAILYREIDDVHFRPQDEYAKYISVAVEYENVHSTAAEEMIKLQRFNAPLTVLITYPPSGCAKEMLDMYSKIIRQADVLENASTTRRQLAIFGYKGGDWEAFVYHDGQFAPVRLQSLAASA